MTKKDIARMEEEIEYRRLVVRREALEAGAIPSSSSP